MQAIRDFLADIDRAWGSSSTRCPLRIIGSAALMLRTGYERSTNDNDILETSDLAPDVRDRLLRLAGPKTALHVRHGMYIQVIKEAVPFLPQQPVWHPDAGLATALKHFDVSVLDVIDVVVSKLKRFDARDIGDIAKMVELGAIEHDRLVERFRRAVDWYAYDARAEELPKYCQNLNRVERDMLMVDETDIELPSWI